MRKDCIYTFRKIQTQRKNNPLYFYYYYYVPDIQFPAERQSHLLISHAYASMYMYFHTFFKTQMVEYCFVFQA